MKTLATIDGIRLAVRDEGSGEAVLLFHTGFVCTGLDPLFGALEDYRLVGYHRRGYGDSDRLPGPASIARQAQDALELMRELGLERAHLVGHSFGADVALEVALRSPEAAASLVLLEPLLPFALAPATGRVVADAAAGAVGQLERGDPRAALDGFLTAAFGPGYREALEARLPGAFTQAVRDVEASFGSELPSLEGWNRGPDDLRALDVPALSVLGAASPWPGFRETHEALLAWLPRCESLVLPRSGHLLQIADPDGVAQGLSAFLTRHPSAVKA